MHLACWWITLKRLTYAHDEEFVFNYVNNTLISSEKLSMIVFIFSVINRENSYQEVIREQFRYFSGKRKSGEGHGSRGQIPGRSPSELFYPPVQFV
jgi:hypothetical protein